MNRRDFMRSGGLLSASLLLRFNPVKQQSVPPGPEGKTLETGDIVRLQHLQTYLGPEFSILSLSAGAGSQVQALIGYKEFNFQLALSEDERTWITI